MEKMTFSLYALLSEKAPQTSNESLAADLNKYFQDEEGFILDFEQLPFAKNRTLVLRWGMWAVRISYEEGAAVQIDSNEIQKRLGSAFGVDVSNIARRIRVVFGSDDELHFTNQIIYIIDFLREINGAIIFDPQKNDLV